VAVAPFLWHSFLEGYERRWFFIRFILLQAAYIYTAMAADIPFTIAAVQAILCMLRQLLRLLAEQIKN